MLRAKEATPDGAGDAAKIPASGSCSGAESLGRGLTVFWCGSGRVSSGGGFCLLIIRVLTSSITARECCKTSVQVDPSVRSNSEYIVFRLAKSLELIKDNSQNAKV